MTASEKTAPMADHTPRSKTRLVVGLIVAAVVLLLVLANTHLVYVATTSQSECISHLKTSGEASGSFRAAKPAC
jgi:hypothetical protein